MKLKIFPPNPSCISRLRRSLAHQVPAVGRLFVSKLFSGLEECESRMELTILRLRCVCGLAWMMVEVEVRGLLSV